MHTSLSEAIKLNAGTFKFDSTLPKLPIPNIIDTFELYLSSVRAIYGNDISHIEKKVERFIESEEAKNLQTELESRRQCMINWLEKWWLDEAYLKDRASMLPYLNIAGRSSLYKSVWPLIDVNVNQSQGLLSFEVIRRASRYIYSMLLFWLCLRLQMLVTHTTKDGEHLCMDQMQKVFNTCRVPDEKQDSLFCCFRPANESKCPCHIIVGCHDRIFMLHCVTDDDQIYKLDHIQTAFQEIVKFCEIKGRGPGIATLSSLPRDQWAVLYNKIRDISHTNATNIDLIQSSILWVCLSTEAPPHPQLLLEKALKVDAKNIWADKSIYISFLSNGLITYGANHAPVDGIALGTALAFAEKEIVCGKGVGQCCLQQLLKIVHIDKPVVWEELKFDLPTEFARIIELAHVDYVDRCCNIDAQTFTFSTFSRSISRQYHLHPDTVFQLCLQLAYARIHGAESPATVYETATTRQFANGRTETIRSCTVDSVKWIRAIICHGPSDPKVVALFLKAHNTHNELRVRSESGRGCDRHILGLRLMSQLAPRLRSPLLDDILSDPSFKATGSNGSFILSTSPMGAADSIGAVAPMCDNGYGVFYRIVEDCCEAAVTSWRSEGPGKGSRLLEELNVTFRLLPLMHKAALGTKL